ncbi:class I SAM-dependent methyltransferase [Actinomycetospora sp. CA-084318]|uniref:class I SAM-dependent methyltransferase n=1 Tax=Actinomycetospora sp. CA-084318 TaxID=3239892 RepID=UPI003D95F31F
MALDTGGTEGRTYTDRLVRLEGARWKRVLDVQAPYRRNLRGLLGGRRVLDVGCGIGRNLVSLSAESVGVDHNATSVEACRRRGLRAVTVDELDDSVGTFDGMLAAHLLEHLEPGTEAEVLRPYTRFLEPGARIVLICPQQRGFRSDATHTVFFDDARLAATLRAVGAQVEAQRSFPFPRWAGRAFTYNEFVTVGRWEGA